MTNEDDGTSGTGVMTVNDKSATAIRFERVAGTDGDTYRLQFLLGPEEVARAEGVSKDSLRNVVGEKNAAAILADDKGKGALVAGTLAAETGVTPGEQERRNGRALVEPEQAAHEPAAAVVERDADDAGATNVVEHVPEAERQQKAKDEADIDVDEALDAVGRRRQRERLAAQQQAVNELGDAADHKRSKVTNLDAKARELDHDNDVGDNVGRPKDRDAQWHAEFDKNRQVELMTQLHAQYRVVGSKFYVKDQPGKVAFKDTGKSIITASNDERISRSMVTMAKAKGWKTIKASGHPDFQRQIWLDGSLEGLEVRGYTPDEKDRKLLEQKRDATMQNAIEQHDHDKARDLARVAKSQGDGREDAGERAGARTGPLERPAVAKAPEAQTERRNAAGVVLEHGAAPYKHNPRAAMNYFVKLDTDKGERTVWGVDLQRAMTEGAAGVGDRVHLAYIGSRMVTVQEPVLDAAGKVVGHKEVDSTRNEWQAVKSDRQKVVEAVAGALAASTIADPKTREAFQQAVEGELNRRGTSGRLPSVAVYDRDAPMPATEADRARPPVERVAERTR